MRIVSLWDVLEFAVKAVVIGIPVISWVSYFWEMGRLFVEAPAPVKIGLFFLVGILTLPLLIVWYGVYEEVKRLEDWYTELTQKEGLSYKGLSGRELRSLLMLRFPFPYVSMTRVGLWLIAALLPFTLIFHFGIGGNFPK